MRGRDPVDRPLHLPSIRRVVEDDPQRPQHREDTRGPLVQVLAEAVLQPGHIDGTGKLRYANAFAKIADRFRRIATATQATDRRHPWIIPATDVLGLYQ